jgi:hypothetical protein
MTDLLFSKQNIARFQPDSRNPTRSYWNNRLSIYKKKIRREINF